MRKFATVLSLLVLCVGTSSAQWNLAQDASATLTSQTTASYSVLPAPSGFDVLMKTGGEGVTDEISVWRTGTGTTSYTLADAAVYDPTLSNLNDDVALTLQGEAAILKGIADGYQVRPYSGVARAKVWYQRYGSSASMNFEIRWMDTGATTITRLPDDLPSGVVN